MRKPFAGIPIPVFWLPFDAIAVYPFIFYHRKKGVPTGSLLRHEQIHLCQQRELWHLPFYCWYVGAFLWHLFATRSFPDAYRQIEFEKEAYTKQDSTTYLTERKPFAFMRT